MDKYDMFRLFKTLHVIAVVLLGSGFVLETITGILAGRARSVAEARVYARLIAFSENWLSPAAAVALAVFAYATADRGGFRLGTTWLVIAQVLFVIIVVVALVFLRPAARKLQAMTSAAPDGPITPDIAAYLKSPLFPVMGTLVSVLFIFIIYLMVSKPAW
ncbi:MAG TPA: DUF2269 family protein [Dehalococcoidia bacterium]|nr:DUF2269 family protein [Dehalococcoidia bacterium]